MKEDFVTYEQAIKLEELGFDLETYQYYKVGSSPKYMFCPLNAEHGAYIPAPTLAQAAKWLREVKGLFINIWLCASGFGWVIEKYGNPNYNGTFVAQHDEESGDDEDSGLFTTYEKALSAGIDAALELIC